MIDETDLALEKIIANIVHYNSSTLTINKSSRAFHLAIVLRLTPCRLARTMFVSSLA